MRKVSVEVQAEVLLPVRISMNVELRADDGAEVGKIVKALCERAERQFNDADVDDAVIKRATLSKPTDDLTQDFVDQLTAYVQERFEAGELKAKVIEQQTLDSR
jgi:hypothetical protein